MLENIVNTGLFHEGLNFRQFLLNALEENDEIKLSTASQWEKLKIETVRFVGFPCMNIKTEPVFYLAEGYHTDIDCYVKVFPRYEKDLGKGFGDGLFPKLGQRFLSLKEIETLPCKEIREKVCLFLKKRVSQRNKQIRDLRKSRNA